MTSRRLGSPNEINHNHQFKHSPHSTSHSHSHPHPSAHHPHPQSGVLPSPATSDSTLSTDSYLYTPENHSTSLPSAPNSKQGSQTLNQLSAHSNFFQSAQFRDGFQFNHEINQENNQAQEVDRFRPRSSQGIFSSSNSNQDSFTPTLANAVEFYSQVSNPSPSPSLLKKRQLGHVRTPSAGRRHSIQSIMPTNGSSSISAGASWSEAASALNAGIGIMESNPSGPFGSNAREGVTGEQGFHAGDGEGGESINHNVTDYLVSPPRNMVNLAPNSHPDWTQGNESCMTSSPDETKRQRVGADFITNTPDNDRRGRDSTPLAPQANDNVTPPTNAWTTIRGLPPNTGSSTASSNRNSNLSGMTQDTSWTPGSPSRSNDALCQSRFGHQMGSELGLDLNLESMGFDPRSHQMLTSFSPGAAFASQQPHSLLDRSLSMSSVSEASAEGAPQISSTAPMNSHSSPQEASSPTAEEVQKEDSQPNKTTAAVKKKREVEEDKWPEEVEVAFWEGLRLIPKLGRRKVLVNGKPCGRNELIGIYIERKTGQARNRKQVSSHIQVLKQSRKGDSEFFELIAEPVHEAQFFMPAGGVSYVQTLAGYGYSGISPNGEGGIVDDEAQGAEAGDDSSLEASPNNAGQSLFQSPSLNKSPLPDSVDSMPPPPPRSAGLSSALEKLHLPTQGARVGSTSAASCPILPATFAMWAHCSDNDAKHVYTLMDRNVMASYSGGRFSAGSTPSLPVIPLDSVRVSAYRFPGLSAMYRRIPCRFLHVHVPLSIPRLSSNGRHFNQFSTQLSLTSKEKERLVSVTSVYSHGGRVLSLVEPLGEPRRIAGAGGSTRADQSSNGQDGVNTPLESLSPWVGSGSPLPDSHGSSSRHRYVHQAPFATDFWADLLSRTHPVHIHEPDANYRPAFSKEPSERAALGMAVSGVTLIQEFIVREDANGSSDLVSRPHVMSEEDASSKVSPGSSIGNVVLVVAWDLECVEALRGQPGVPTVSVLELPMEQTPSQQKRRSASSLGASPATATSALPESSSSSRYPVPVMKLISLNKPLGLSSKASKPTPPPKKIASLPIFQPSSSTNSANSSKPVTPRMGEVPTLAHTAPTPEQQLGKARRTSEAQAHAVPARCSSPAPSADSRSPSPQRPTLSSSSSGSSINLQPPSSGSLARKRGVSIEKRLTVSIPPVPSYLANGGSAHLRGSGSSSDGGSQNASPSAGAATNAAEDTSPALVSAASSHNPVTWGQMQQRAMHTPITPFPQVSQTPDAPPPLVAHDEAKAQRERLARKWAQESGADLKSPLDGAFSGPGVPSMTSYEIGAMEYQQGHSFPQHPSSMAMTPGTGLPMHLQQQQTSNLLGPASQSIEGALLSPVGFPVDQPNIQARSDVYSNIPHQRQVSNPTMHNGFEMGLNFGAGFGMQMSGSDVEMGSCNSNQQPAFSEPNPQDPDDFMDQLYTHLQTIDPNE